MEFYGEERATDIRDFVSEHGFMVLKNAISNHDAARLHDLFGECFEAQSMQHKDSLNSRILPGASHLIPSMASIITSEKIIQCLRVICGDDLFYTSHSDLHEGFASSWHKDDGGGKYFESLPDYFENTMCKVFKVGLYLQDCSVDGGLSVRDGSHRVKDKKVGEQLYVPTGLNDVVIFDVRLTHKGWFPSEGRILRLLNSSFRKLNLLPAKAVPFQRRSIFFTYGAPNLYTEAFSRQNMARQCSQLGRDISSMPLRLAML